MRAPGHRILHDRPTSVQGDQDMAGGAHGAVGAQVHFVAADDDVDVLADVALAVQGAQGQEQVVGGVLQVEGGVGGGCGCARWRDGGECRAEEGAAEEAVLDGGLDPRQAVLGVGQGHRGVGLRRPVHRHVHTTGRPAGGGVGCRLAND